MISKVPKWIGDLAQGNLLKPMKVLKIQNLSSTVKKMRFYGDISRMDFSPGNGNAILVSDNDLRNYTVSYYDKSKNEFEIIFYLNEIGIGSQLINSLKIDNEVFMDSPRGKTCYKKDIKKYFFVGDETSLGLACSLIPLFKQNNHQYKFFFELDENNQSIPTELGLDNFQIFRKEQFNSEAIEGVFSTSKQDLENAQFILTGNVNSVQHIRREIKEKEIDSKIYAKGYWLKGKKGL